MTSLAIMLAACGGGGDSGSGNGGNGGGGNGGNGNGSNGNGSNGNGNVNALSLTLTLQDVVERHMVVDLAMDQYGSRFIQQKIREMTSNATRPNVRVNVESVGPLVNVDLLQMTFYEAITFLNNF